VSVGPAPEVTGRLDVSAQHQKQVQPIGMGEDAAQRGGYTLGAD